MMFHFFFTHMVALTNSINLANSPDSKRPHKVSQFNEITKEVWYGSIEQVRGNGTEHYILTSLFPELVYCENNS